MTKKQRGKVVWHGADPLKVLLLALDAIECDQNNARRHPPASLEAVRESFNAFGQTRPVVVHGFRNRPVPTVIAGNAGYLAARALGWTHIACIAFNGTDARARAYAVTDNRTAELSAWDEDRLLIEAIAMRSDDVFADLVKTLALPEETEGRSPNTRAVGDLRYAIVIDCDDESQQLALLGRYESEGLKCRALIL